MIGWKFLFVSLFEKHFKEEMVKFTKLRVEVIKNKVKSAEHTFWVWSWNCARQLNWKCCDKRRNRQHVIQSFFHFVIIGALNDKLCAKKDCREQTERREKSTLPCRRMDLIKLSWNELIWSWMWSCCACFVSNEIAPIYELNEKRAKTWMDFPVMPCKVSVRWI